MKVLRVTVRNALDRWERCGEFPVRAEGDDWAPPEELAAYNALPDDVQEALDQIGDDLQPGDDVIVEVVYRITAHNVRKGA